MSASTVPTPVRPSASPPATSPSTTSPWANQRITTQDGTRLALDVHLPPEELWPVPVVATRTAYGRSTHLAEGRAWRRAGLALAVQDVRGRYDSEGTWTPYRNERADGAHLIDHLLTQPWCDGRVIAYGGSYSGYTAWTMAVERPEHVLAVISLGASLGLHRTKFTPSGVLRLAEHVGWWLERADARTSRPGLRETLFSEDPEALTTLPLTCIADRLGVDLPQLWDAVELHHHHGYDGLPPEALTTEELGSLRCAALHAGGWFDLLAPEVVDLWNLVGSHATPRPPRRLVVGPWEHDLGMAGATTTGVLDHGSGSRLPWGATMVDWVRRILAEDTAGSRGPHRTPADTPPARSQAHVFRMGQQQWVTHEQWPPPAINQSWFTSADGALAQQPAPQGTVTYRYDPDSPYPSVRTGHDRLDTLGRADAARWWTPALTTAVVVEGPPHLELVAATSAHGTDWIARLCELDVRGRLVELASGTATADDGGQKRHIIPMTPTSVVVPTGSRLLLEVTSSDFPFLARHLGTGADRLSSHRTQTAEQSVTCGAATFLTLPVLPSDPGARAAVDHGGPEVLAAAQPASGLGGEEQS